MHLSETDLTNVSSAPKQESTQGNSCDKIDQSASKANVMLESLIHLGCFFIPLF
jgi:hypothetical protein